MWGRPPFRHRSHQEPYHSLLYRLVSFFFSPSSRAVSLSCKALLSRAQRPEAPVYQLAECPPLAASLRTIHSAGPAMMVTGQVKPRVTSIYRALERWVRQRYAPTTCEHTSQCLLMTLE